MWTYNGTTRPPFALTPAAGQESVWDYPRPPRLERDARRVEVRFGDAVIASTTGAYRVLETASPPTFYLPPEDVEQRWLVAAGGSSFCEWKGHATYWTVRGEGFELAAAGWSYPDPTAPFAPIRDHLSFYPARLDCRVGGVRVEPQPGDFYGGWMTPEIVGPVKGEPGTGGW